MQFRAVALAKARVWADGEMTKALESAKSGGDRTAAAENKAGEPAK